MERPYVICHMLTSVDGKVTGEFLGNDIVRKAEEIYYDINREYKADAFACGRITMESSFTGGYKPDLSGFFGTLIARKDFLADKNASFFAVSFDRRGVVGWKNSRIQDADPGYGNAHIIEVLCEDAEDEYLAYLQSIGVSYIFAGKHDTDIVIALNKLYKLFNIKQLLLEGGSIINGAFYRAGVIDELSLVTAPVIAHADDKPLFWNSTSTACYYLCEHRQYDGAVYTNYKKSNI